MIVLSNSMVVPTASVGTVVGSLTVFDADGTARTSYLSLTEDEAGSFRIVGNNLVTMRTPMAPGYYSVRVKAVAQYVRLSNDADFVIIVAPKASNLLGMAPEVTEDTGVSVAAVSVGE